MNARTYPLDAVARYCPDDRISVRNLTAATRLPQHRVSAWLKAGHVDEPTADLIATRLDTHPSLIWPDWGRPTRRYYRRSKIAREAAGGTIDTTAPFYELVVAIDKLSGVHRPDIPAERRRDGRWTTEVA